MTDGTSPTSLDPPVATPVGDRPRRFGRLLVEVRREARFGTQIATQLAAVLVGLGLSGFILTLAGVPPRELVHEFLLGTVLDARNLRAVLFQAAPLILVGLSAALAFKARFWNIGIDGQMILGGIGATAVSLSRVGPDDGRLILMALGAIVFGTAWSLVPALLRLRLGISEIISTLLLNYVAYQILLQLLFGVWKDPEDNLPHSPKFPPSDLLPALPDDISSALLVAVGVTVLVAYVTGRSKLGYYMRFISDRPSMARAVGIPVTGAVLLTVVMSGCIASLAGFVLVAGQEGRLTQSYFTGFGVSGVLIGFLARSHPVAAAVVAVLMAVLFVSGQNLQVFYSVPQAMVQLIQAIIVICVAGSEFLVRHRLRWID